MLKWKDLQTSTKHLIILIPVFFIWMFLNAGIFLPILNSCNNYKPSYFGSLQYLQTVVFTIGYGHVVPLCIGGKVYTFIFAYLTIPLLFYILSLFGRKIINNVMVVEKLLLKAFTLRARIITILTFDFTIGVVFLLIPTGILVLLEPCEKNYAYLLWYVFTTITTIGFGDYVAGTNTRRIGQYYCVTEDKDDFYYHQDNFFWVSKMGFLLVSSSFLLASLILKSETIVEYFYSPTEKIIGKKRLIENEESAENIEEIGMNERQSNISTIT